MRIKAGRKSDGPCERAEECARENGFTLEREPFGKRGTNVEIYLNGKMIGYRKSYQGAINFMKKHKGEPKQMRPKSNVKNPTAMIIKNIPKSLRKAVNIAAQEADITAQELHRRALFWAINNMSTIKNMENVI